MLEFSHACCLEKFFGTWKGCHLERVSLRLDFQQRDALSCCSVYGLAHRRPPRHVIAQRISFLIEQQPILLVLVVLIQEHHRQHALEPYELVKYKCIHSFNV